MVLIRRTFIIEVKEDISDAEADNLLMRIDDESIDFCTHVRRLGTVVDWTDEN